MNSNERIRRMFQHREADRIAAVLLCIAVAISLPRLMAAAEVETKSEPTKPAPAVVDAAASAAKRLGLEPPVTVKQALAYRDGGTIYIQLQDANGKLYPFCLDRQLHHTRPSHVFTGADYPGKPHSVEQPVGGEVEAALRAILRAWVDTTAPAVQQAELLEDAKTMGGSLSDPEKKLLFVLHVCRELADREGCAEAAWGKPVDGLEWGLAFAETKRSFHPGESVRFRLFVRNLTEHSAKLDLLNEDGPRWIQDCGALFTQFTIHHADGRNVNWGGVINSVYMGKPVTRTMNPGDIVSLTPPILKLRTREEGVGRRSLNEIYLEPDDYRLNYGPTGELTFTVEEKKPAVDAASASKTAPNP